MADLTVKLGADTSEFRGQVQAAANSVANSLGTGAGTSAGGKFIAAFENRLLNARQLSTALATALGLNIQSIAEKAARLITGVSKEEEESLKRMAILSEKLSEVTKKNNQDRLAEEDLLRVKRLELGQLQAKLAANEAQTNEERANAYQTQIEIQEKELEVRKLANSLRDKGFEEDLKWFHRVEDIKKAAAKEDADKMRKMGEEDAAWYKKKVAQEQELKELKLQAMKPEERVIELQKERLDLERKIAKEKRDGVDTLADDIKLAKLDAQIRADALDIEQNITKEKKEQAKAAMTASGDLGVAKLIGGFATYNDPIMQRNYEQSLIEQAKRDIQGEIDTLQGQIDAYTKSGSAMGRYEIPALRERVQALRGRSNKVSEYVFNPNYQDKAGAGIFSQQVSTIGDPLKLQAEQTDTLKTVADGVGQLNERLRVAGFTTGK